MKNLSPEELNSIVLEAQNPILIDFYSVSCKPCKDLVPVLEQLSAEVQGVSFFKFDVASDKFSFAVKHKIMSVPTLMIFSGGKMIGRRSGSAPKAEIKKWLEETI